MEKIVFKNGLTLALVPKIDAHSAAIAFYIASGNRFETHSTSGISHFIEHMVFKGTNTRTAADISEESDIMGGQLNAYTSKEYTCFYSRALYEHVPKTLHLLCDMLCNPLFAKHDVEIEKGVILEEIGMYEDSPEDLSADNLTAVCYKDKPLGFNILGTKNTVASFSPDDLRTYMDKVYVPERMVVSICGKFDRDVIIEILESYFGAKKNTQNPLGFEREKIMGGYSLCRKPIEQTQLSLCFNGLEIGHPLRYACSFLSSIAGGSVSSRINRRIREELGLAYSAYTFSSSYLGAGMFGIAAGLAHKNQEKFLLESLKILKDISHSITDAEVARTKEQFKAGIVLSNESMAQIAAQVGRGLLLEGKYTEIEEVIKQIDAVDVNAVKEVAELVINPSVFAVSVVGDAKTEDYYRNIIEACF